MATVDDAITGEIVRNGLGVAAEEASIVVVRAGHSSHIQEGAEQPGMTGPEVQVQDNQDGTDPQKSGWLYQLYPAANDPKTGKPFDATKPAGEWNTLRIVINKAPAKSEIFKKYPSFSKNHHATSFLADTLKVLLTGAVEDHHLSEILDHARWCALVHQSGGGTGMKYELLRPAGASVGGGRP